MPLSNNASNDPSNSSAQLQQPTPASKPKPSSTTASFEDVYLRKVTAELSEDIDAVRAADDFSDRSVAVLVRALRQGVGIYGQEARRTAMGGEGGGKRS
ncbi:MAG: hypothetical protein M1833_004693 [Piccolia ochrophora]|nr:MAG: hypothetical protein M1833_004693 [Piccolia ochrophora]